MRETLYRGDIYVYVHFPLTVVVSSLVSRRSVFVDWASPSAVTRLLPRFRVGVSRATCTFRS